MSFPRIVARPPGPRFPDAPPVIGIIPGSRKSEVKANFPHLLEVMQRIHAAYPTAHFNIPTTSAGDAIVHDLLQKSVPDPLFDKMGPGPAMSVESEPDPLSDKMGPGPFMSVNVQCDAFDELIRPCDLCITKSGTSTLHVAAWNVPMIVVYRINPLAWHLAGRWLVKTKKIALVNILAGQTDLVPEFIPWYGSNQPVADCAIDLLKHPEKLAASARNSRHSCARSTRPARR